MDESHTLYVTGHLNRKGVKKVKEQPKKKSTRTKLVCCLLAALMLTASTSAMAAPTAEQSKDQAQQTESVQPRVAANIRNYVTKYSNTQLKVHVSVVLNAAKATNITAQLQRWNGSQWLTTNTYMASGNDIHTFLIRYANAPKGYQYRVHAVITVNGLGTYVSDSPTYSW